MTLADFLGEGVPARIETNADRIALPSSRGCQAISKVIHEKRPVEQDLNTFGGKRRAQTGLDIAKSPATFERGGMSFPLGAG